MVNKKILSQTIVRIIIFMFCFRKKQIKIHIFTSMFNAAYVLKVTTHKISDDYDL